MSVGGWGVDVSLTRRSRREYAVVVGVILALGGVALYFVRDDVRVRGVREQLRGEGLMPPANAQELERSTIAFVSREIESRSGRPVVLMVPWGPRYPAGSFGWAAGAPAFAFDAQTGLLVGWTEDHVSDDVFGGEYLWVDAPGRD